MKEDRRTRQEILEESIKLLRGMQKELSRDKVKFEDITDPGNQRTNCPMERVENRNHIDYRCIGCPLDEKQSFQIFDRWTDCIGCFERCLVFQSFPVFAEIDGSVFSEIVLDIEKNIGKLKRELKAYGKSNKDTNW